MTPDIAQTLTNRFTLANHLNLVQDDGQRRLEAPSAWFLGMSHLDQLLATWQWRRRPTPWLGRWLNHLPDRQAKARVAARLIRLTNGYFGDCKPVGNGVWEARIDW